MAHKGWQRPRFSTHFLPKCHETRTRTNGGIFIGGFITIIGEHLGVDFSHFQPVDDGKPNYLLNLQCLTTIRSIRARSDGSTSWLGVNKKYMYCLPCQRISSFSVTEHTTWVVPPNLTEAGDYVSDEDDEDEDEDDDPDFQDDEEEYDYQGDGLGDVPMEDQGAGYNRYPGETSGAGFAQHQHSDPFPPYQYSSDPIPPYCPPPYSHGLGDNESLYSQLTNAMHGFGLQSYNQNQQVRHEIGQVRTEVDRLHTRIDGIEQSLGYIPNRPDWEYQWLHGTFSDQPPPFYQRRRRSRHDPPPGGSLQ